MGSKNRISSSDLHFFYFSNNDGSIRWLISEQAASPLFLSLYNPNNLKGKIFARAVKIAFGLGLQSKLLRGKLTLESADFYLLGKFLSETNADNYAIFTGTAGENRKIVIALSSHGRVSHFAKIPTTKGAADLVNQERRFLGMLRDYSWKYLHFPSVEYFNDRGVSITNIKPARASSPIKWSKAHSLALLELSGKTVFTSRIIDTIFYKKMNTRLAQLEGYPYPKNGINVEVYKALLAELQLLAKALPTESRTSFSYGHGDFTPWNMYVSNGNLFVYDWELAGVDYPLFYDYFHFHFQGGILVQKSNAARILSNIDKGIKRDASLQTFIENKKISLNLLLKLYLFYVTTYYTKKYVKQCDLHLQVHWLLETWLDALRQLNKK